MSDEAVGRSADEIAHLMKIRAHHKAGGHAFTWDDVRLLLDLLEQTRVERDTEADAVTDQRERIKELKQKLARTVDDHDKDGKTVVRLARGLERMRSEAESRITEGERDCDWIITDIDRLLLRCGGKRTGCMEHDELPTSHGPYCPKGPA